MLEIKNVSFEYKRHEPVLSDISFSVNDGTFLAVLGNNGSGKSTLLHCLSGILKPIQGDILYEGKSMCRTSKSDLSKLISLVEQDHRPSIMTVFDAVLLGRKPYIATHSKSQNLRIVQDAINTLGINSIALRELDELSGGERQKVNLARVLAQESCVMLLDEPINGLDIYSQHSVLQWIKRLVMDKAIISIMAIHDINLALQYCNKFLIIDNKTIYDYGDKEVLDEKCLRDVYSVDVEVLKGEHFDVLRVKGVLDQ